jgi:hypothetical protein
MVDIDLFFGIEETLLQQTLADWTERMYGKHLRTGVKKNLP